MALKRHCSSLNQRNLTPDAGLSQGLDKKGHWREQTCAQRAAKSILQAKEPWERENSRLSGGGGGIRTHETLSGLTVFKTVAFNRSATPPTLKLS